MTKETIAAFDFDGTLTYRDSFFIFLTYTFGWKVCICRAIPLIPRFLGYLCGAVSRTAVKEALLTQFFKGMPIDEVRRRGAVFSKEKLPSQMRPEAIRCLRWHQRKGHRCIIVSASVDVWLLPWAQANGIEKVLASSLKVDESQRVTGKLSGKNCRREEKVKRLKEALGPLDRFVLFAYGDSDGDKEMLEAADYPYYRKFPNQSV